MKKNIIFHLKIFVIIIIYYFILYVLEITCPFLALFKTPCPGCGSTRAIVSLLKGDLDAYVHYNPTAIFIAITLFIAFHQKLFGKFVHKKLLTVMIIFFTLIIMIVYLFRIFT